MDDNIPEQGDFTPDLPDPLQMEIDELQAHESYLNESHPMHKVTLQKVTQLYRQKYPEPTGPESPPGTPQPPEKTPSPIPGVELPELPGGWDEDALKAFAPIAREMGFSDEELKMELESFAAGTSRFDPTEYDVDSGISALNERWGQGAAGIVRAAQEYIASLPAGTRAKLEDWLESTGLGSHPKVIESLARRNLRGGK